MIRFVPQARPAVSARRGLTLLEVLLALMIFAGAFAAISQLYYSGSRAALRAQHETDAVLRAESTLTEMLAGALPLTSQGATPFDDDPAWTWEAEILPAVIPDLMQVTVTVRRPAVNGSTEVEFLLLRLVRDPQLYLDAAANAATLAAEAEE